jgi:nicotinamidase-related amidase
MALPKMNAEPFPLEFDPRLTALLMIDMQRDFLEPGGFGEMLGNDVSRVRSSTLRWTSNSSRVVRFIRASAPARMD